VGRQERKLDQVAKRSALAVPDRLYFGIGQDALPVPLGNPRHALGQWRMVVLMALVMPVGDGAEDSQYGVRHRCTALVLDTVEHGG
jgi:hypothetical protein